MTTEKSETLPSRMKKSASAHEVKLSNGTGKEEKKSKFANLLKKYFHINSATNQVGSQLWPVLTLLRIGGTLPIGTCKKKDGVPAFSAWNMYSLPTITTGSLFLYWWGSILQNQTNEYRFDLFKPSLEFPLNRLTSMLQPALQIAEILCGWYTCTLMRDYLNNWQTFETSFISTFKDVYKYKFNMRRLRDFFLIFYVIFPFLFFLQNQEYLLSSELLRDSKDGLSHVLISSLVFFSMVEDVKVILMYRATQGNFREIRNGISAQYKIFTALTRTPLGPEKVKQWIQLLNQARNQHKLAVKIQTPHQLISMAITVILLASNLLLFATSVLENSRTQSGIAFLPLGIFLLLLFRLALKCVMAEKVTEEEQTIAQELVQMESSGGNIFIKMELKFLYDLIVSKPTVTVYGSLIRMRQGLIIHLVGHVVTCLIIMMQFNISSRMDSPILY